MSKKILRMKKVAERYGVSISTPWRWANEKRFEYLNFPKPVSYGPNTSGIAEDALDAYDAERVAMRDGDSNTDDDTNTDDDNDDNDTDDDDERPP